MAEAIRIGEEGGVPVQVSHLKACLKANWPKMGEVLRTIETARARGVDVTADMYPYTAGSTTLASLLPVWAHEGGMPALLARLADGGTRRRILDGGRAAGGRVERAERPRRLVGRPGRGVPARARRRGKDHGRAGRRAGSPGGGLFIDLLLEAEGQVSMINFLMLDANVARGPPVPAT